MGFLLSEHGESEDKHHNYAQEEYAGENICTFPDFVTFMNLKKTKLDFQQNTIIKG